MYPEKLLTCDTTEYLQFKVEMEGFLFFLSCVMNYGEFNQSRTITEEFLIHCSP